MNIEQHFNSAPQIVPTDTIRHPEYPHGSGDRVKEVQKSAQDMAINKIVMELQDHGKHADAVKDLKELLNGKSDHEKEKIAKTIRHREGNESQDALVIAPMFDQNGKKTGQSEIGIVDRNEIDNVKKHGELIKTKDQVDQIEAPHPFKDLITMPWRAVEALVRS
jgi:hypothetical protein